MEILLFVLFSGLGSLGPSNVDSVECTAPDNKQYADCACQMSDSRKFVNLAALEHNLSVPRFTAKGIDQQDKNWLFSYNPCTTFDVFKGESNVGYKACIDVAAARWSNQSAHRCNGLGDSNSATFRYATQLKEFVVSNLTLSFRNMTTQEAAVISLVCNSTIPQNKSVFKHLGTDNALRNTYYLLLEGECCCPGLCDSPPGGSSKRKSESDKDDSWIIIIGGVLGGIVLVVVVGIFCCKKKNRGYQSV